MAGHRQKLAALPASDAHPHLCEASTTLLSETLLQVHDQMVRMLGDKLSAAALHVSGIAEHSGLLNATHEFRKHAAAIQGHFVQQVVDALKQARPVRTRATRDTLESGLELVDELSFEDWLATSSEANKLEEQFREQLADIEPRIGQLFGFACDHSNNPSARPSSATPTAAPCTTCRCWRAPARSPTPRCATSCPSSSLRSTPSCWRCCRSRRRKSRAISPSRPSSSPSRLHRPRRLPRLRTLFRHRPSLWRRHPARCRLRQRRRKARSAG